MLATNLIQDPLVELVLLEPVDGVSCCRLPRHRVVGGVPHEGRDERVVHRDPPPPPRPSGAENVGSHVHLQENFN